MEKLLTICIPTYNRLNNLSSNISLLEKQILKANLNQFVKIDVSDNGSTDNTGKYLREIKENLIIDIDYALHTSNLGFEKNILFLVRRVSTPYLMLLGDDDYLSEGYLKTIIDEIQRNKEITCIIPNFWGVTSDGEVVYNRDPYGLKKVYQKGFLSCLENSWKAHQVSGLVFKNNNLYNCYIKKKVHNIYPQIFFLSVSCLEGNCLYLPDFPVKVTQVPQSQKDWNYGKDALINDIFDNYKKIDITYKERSLLEDKLNRTQKRHLWNTSHQNINKQIENILSAPNFSYLGRLRFMRQLVAEGSYSGWKYSFILYLFAQVILLKKLIFRKCIGLN